MATDVAIHSGENSRPVWAMCTNCWFSPQNDPKSVKKSACPPRHTEQLHNIRTFTAQLLASKHSDDQVFWSNQCSTTQPTELALRTHYNTSQMKSVRTVIY